VSSFMMLWKFDLFFFFNVLYISIQSIKVSWRFLSNKNVIVVICLQYHCFFIIIIINLFYFFRNHLLPRMHKIIVRFCLFIFIKNGRLLICPWRRSIFFHRFRSSPLYDHVEIYVFGIFNVVFLIYAYIEVS